MEPRAFIKSKNRCQVQERWMQKNANNIKVTISLYAYKSIYLFVHVYVEYASWEYIRREKGNILSICYEWKFNIYEIHSLRHILIWSEIWSRRANATVVLCSIWLNNYDLRRLKLKLILIVVCVKFAGYLLLVAVSVSSM